MINEENETTANKNFVAGSGIQNDKSTISHAAKAGINSENESAGEAVINTAKKVLEQAKDSAGQAYGLAADKAASKIDEQKNNFSNDLGGFADRIRKVSDTLRDGEENKAATLTAKYGESIADQIEQVSDYFEKKDFPEIVRDVEKFARRQPIIFIAAAFVTGLLAARFFKSTDNATARPRLNGSHADEKRLKSNTNNNQPKPSAS